ncbi:MAG: ribonuclease HII [Calditerrivibrio sp.]|nr:ribonuclease HII [Calditerrivibrio sp.]
MDLEQNYRKERFEYLRYVGIDEVGRGCLAGPVVAAAVVLKGSFYDRRIIDSKKLKEKERDLIYQLISENALSIGIGVVCSSMVDTLNILNATKQAMHIALSKINVSYDKIVIDAVKLKNIEAPLEVHLKAEDKFIEVAAASIIAKVTRDRMMKRMHYLFPAYGWYDNKGYGTKYHVESIKRYGITPLHRKSFLKGIL